MAKKLQMPELVFIGPPKSRTKFKYTLFRVVTRDENGIPRELEILHDQDMVDWGAMEKPNFMVGYVPAHVLAPKK